MWFQAIDQHLRAELRRVAGLGMQQAAEMLSQLLQQPVEMTVPGVVSAAQLQAELAPSTPGLGISLGVSGELSGGMLLFFSPASAAWLSGQLLGQPPGEDLLAEPACSTLKEVGNIIASAFLASLDNQLQLRALPTPPQLCYAALAELLTQQRQAQLAPGPLVANRLSGIGPGGQPLQGRIYLCPEIAALERLLARVAAAHS